MLQPLLFYWGLPLVALPVLIHFLNRLRYRNQPWAAMQFLLTATRSSARLARFRQWLVLICRMLAVFFLALALARPHLGGWLGLALGGPPDTVMILLDRSASMELADAQTRKPLRAEALALLQQVAATFPKTTSVVLLDSLTCKPLLLTQLEVLPDLPVAQATDTAADLPTMLLAAAQYLTENPAARPEIWLTSDLQRSNWRPEDKTWAAATARLTALPRKPHVRLLALTTTTKENLAVNLLSATRVRRHGQDELRVGLLVQGGVTGETRRVPLTLEVDGHSSALEVTLDGPRLVVQQAIPLGDRAEGGWGRVALPPDDNLRDNSAYFAYPPRSSARSLVVAEQPACGALLALTAAPAPEALSQSATTITPGEFAKASLSDVALVLWQGLLPDKDSAPRLEAFVRAGGALLLLPPVTPAPGATFLGDLAWGGDERGAEEQPFKVADWRTEEGPLANTISGERLPLEQVQTKLRRHATVPATETLATYTDGQPLLARRRLDAGEVLLLNTLPLPAWSTLGDGTVLVPLVQRLLGASMARRGGVKFAVCGELDSVAGNTPGTAAIVWRSADGTERNPRAQAGVYRHGTDVLVTNRPTSEDQVGRLADDEIAPLFPGLPLTLSLQANGPQEHLESEVTTGVLILALLAVLAEALLTLPARLAAAGATAPTVAPGLRPSSAA